jgi:hypothetical protein
MLAEEGGKVREAAAPIAESELGNSCVLCLAFEYRHLSYLLQPFATREKRGDRAVDGMVQYWLKRKTGRLVLAGNFPEP